MNVQYSAWLREAIGRDGEQFTLPTDIRTVGMLLDWLAARGGKYERALEFDAMLMVFVNQRFADRNHAVSDNDDVCLIPPIAGG